jgi:hypothetical protein
MRHLSRPQRTVLPQSVSRFSLHIQGRPATVATSLGEIPQERYPYLHLYNLARHMISSIVGHSIPNSHSGYVDCPCIVLLVCQDIVSHSGWIDSLPLRGGFLILQVVWVLTTRWCLIYWRDWLSDCNMESYFKDNLLWRLSLFHHGTDLQTWSQCIDHFRRSWLDPFSTISVTPVWLSNFPNHVVADLESYHVSTHRLSLLDMS